MKTQRLAVSMLALALFSSSGTVTADICVDKNLKPLKHFCGTVIDSSGTPIPNATVSVFKGGIEVAAKSTNAAGEFSFESLESGKYEFHAGATGFGKVVFRFEISKPSAKCKQKVEIQLAVAGECSHVRLAK
jgi:protocatechuate 3,4-dioxygenase beta subunit